MKRCERGAKNLILAWISMIVLFTLGIPMLCCLFFYQGRTPGAVLFQQADMLSPIVVRLSMVAFGTLFTGAGLYLAVQLIRTKGMKIEFDEGGIVFDMRHEEKWCIPWSMLREPTVRITWVSGRRQLIFAFSDGRRLTIASNYKGFQQLYEALARSGAPIIIKKTRQEEKPPECEAAMRRRLAITRAATIVTMTVTVVCFSLGALEKYGPKGDLVPFDPSNPVETYAYLDVYSATALAYTTGNSTPKIYFYCAYNSDGTACIFAMDALYPALEAPCDPTEAGPIFRLQGYTLKHYPMLRSMLMQDMELSEEEFQALFGVRYLTASQESGLYNRYIVIAAFSAAFSLLGLLALRMNGRRDKTGRA